MSDLTVLVSPTPLYHQQNSSGFNFARRSQNDLSRPVMVTLESVDADEDGPRSPIEVAHLNAAFLSPPRRTFKSRSPPERPASAPPLTVPLTASDPLDTRVSPVADVPRRAFSSSTPSDWSPLSRPPPPLFRPTTFWRRAKRSGVASASYSPSSHLIRRSTFIAAGLTLDKPEADLSAFGVESRETMVYIQPQGATNPDKVNQAISSTEATSLAPNYAARDEPTSATPLPTTISDADSDATTDPQDAVVSSDIPTTSLIRITALPPATSSSHPVLPKLPYRRQLDILYLVPLFIVAGVVLGTITTAIFFKWRESRRRVRRASTLLPGPPYVPPENEVEGYLLVHGYPSMEQVSLFAASTPSKFTIHGSRYIPGRPPASQSLNVTQPFYTHPNYTQTIVPASDGERFTVVTREDPFLVPSPTSLGESAKLSSDASLPKISVSPSLPDPNSGDNSVPCKAPITNLPRPFRRSMFDILKLGGPQRHVPSTREGYTALAPDESVEKTPTNRARRASSVKATRMHTLSGESNSHGIDHSLDDGSHTGDMEDALGLLGLQDCKHDPADDPIVLPKKALRVRQGTLSSPTQGEKTQKPRRVTPFSSEFKESPKEGHGEGQSPNTRKEDEIEEKYPDIFTKAPQRRCSRTPTKRVLADRASRRFSAPDTHASVLPLSPPSLMSPPLEKSLFFTSLSSSASLAGRMNTLASVSSSPLHRGDRSPEHSPFTSPSKKTKKLRTKRPEPPLPYPSYPDQVHANRTPVKRSSSADTNRPSFSPRSPKPKSLSTTATFRESTVGICALGSLSPTSLAVALASSSSSDTLTRVNDIVAQGYTKKRFSTGGGEEVAAKNSLQEI